MSDRPEKTWTLEPPEGERSPVDPKAASVGGPGAEDRYRIGSEFGRGGHARVLLAQDRELGREVAWKELLPASPYAASSTASASREARFVQEARITGLLEHPNIVPVYELGRRSDGSPYYTMRVIRGEPLDRRLEACGGLDDRLRYLGAFMDLCNAIAFAHSKGVIHRDLKPSNVMVGAFGETVVLDWGIAKARGVDDARGQEIAERIRKLQDGRIDQTTVGWAVGTPAYMSPEQADGRVDDIDERSDVWGLGAVLYELLTGRPPFEGDNVYHVVSRVRTEAVESVLTLCPGAPRELVAVAEKALRRDPALRYQSAAELAEEVQAYLSGRRVRAYEYSSWELLRRFAVRNKVAVAASGVVALAVLVSLVLVAAAWRSAEDARVQERAQRTQANFVLSQAYSQQADRLLLGRQSLASRVFAAASLINNPANPLGPAYDEGFALRQPLAEALLTDAHSRLYQAEHRAVERLTARYTARNSATDAAFSPDGGKLAVAEYEAGFTVRELPSGQVLLEVPDRGGIVFGLRFMADGERLIVAGEEPALQIWDVERGVLLVEVDDPNVGPTSFVALSRDGALMATRAASIGDVALWSTEDGSLVGLVRGPGARVTGADFAPDGREIAVVNMTGPPWIGSVATGEQLLTLPVPADTTAWWAAYAPDGESLVTAATDGAATLWDRATGEPLLRMALEEEPIYYATFSPDGARIATAGARGSVSLWDPATGRLELSVREHSDSVLSVAFSSDGRQLVSVGLDRAVLLWYLRSGDGLSRWLGNAALGRIAYSPAGDDLVTVGLDGEVCLWKVEGDRIACLSFGGVDQKGLAYSPDGQRLALGGADGTVTVIDAHSGRRLHSFQAHDPLVWALAYTPDGRVLATGGGDLTIKLWDAESFELLRTLEGVDKHLWTLDISPDGALLVTGGPSPLRIWDLAGGQLLRELEVSSELVSSVGWMGQGHQLITGGRDGRLQRWDADTGALVRTYRAHPSAVEGLALRPGGRVAATVDGTGTVRLWDLEIETPQLSLLRAQDSFGLAFSPDGRQLAVLDGDQAVAYPLDRIPEPRDPARLLAEAERDAASKLEGFLLER